MLRSVDSRVIGGQQILYLRRDPMPACLEEDWGGFFSFVRMLSCELEQHRLSEAPRRILIPT